MAPLISIIASMMTVFAVTSATRFHVNHGCINANGQAICHDRGNPITITSSKASIDARFSGNGQLYSEIPGCNAVFVWPKDYGDIFYGKDNCLYDAKGQNIGGQCCVFGNGKTVRNPYNVFYG